MTTSSIVMTVPPGLADEFDRRFSGITRTGAVFNELFHSARKSLDVVTPYVDPTFTALVTAARVPVRLVTSPPPGRPRRAILLLDRCAAMCDLAVRYVDERPNRAPVFQMHARMLIADRARAYIGSACPTDTATHYNAEIGLLIHERPVIAQLQRVFDYFFDHVGTEADAL